VTSACQAARCLRLITTRPTSLSVPVTDRIAGTNWARAVMDGAWPAGAVA